METRITAINKDTDRFKQEFLFKESAYGARTRHIEIHSQPENFYVKTTPPESAVIKVYRITGTTLDSPGTKTLVASGINWNNYFLNNQFRLRTDVGTAYRGTLLVEVETKYDPNKDIGLGSDYLPSAKSTTERYWAGDSYARESDINCKHLITVNQGANGRISADPGSAKVNATVTLSATPDTGYELDHFTVTDSSNNPVNVTGNTFTMPDADVNVTATFRKKAPPKYKVTVNGMQNGTVTASPTETEAGKTVQLQVTPAGNYQLQSITITDGQGNTIPVDMANYTFTMPASNVSVSAIFVEKPPETYNVNLVSSPPLGGTVGASPTSGKAGTEVTVSATANTGYTLTGISVVDANNKPVTLNNNKFTMPASNVTVTATFTKNPDPQTPGTEIHEGELALIKNKQTGLDMKIFKRTSWARA